MAINIRSYNELLGEMIRKIVANTPVNDIAAGSAMMTLLEAAAQVDFENNASILSLLELLNVDTTRNIDLDARAADYGLYRTPSVKATGAISIQDSSITKRSTGLYQVKPAPIAGQTTLFVNNAAGWSPTGQLFVGRGTPNFEGPVSYTSITNNGSFYAIALSSALQKDHLISESVVDAQGTTNRLVAAGTLVYIPANNQNPQIDFVTVRDAVIPAGEDTVNNVAIIATVAGAQSNAGINTITKFGSDPFTGSITYNPVALNNGADAEIDEILRERLKSYASTLARGTKAAILNAVIGVSDSEDSKQVASASITEPPVVGDPSILYIDDGTGFEPSFQGQSVDVLIAHANGDEEFLQLSNYPLPRPQVINAAEGPYELSTGMTLRVLVDGIEDSVSFSTSQFTNISSARIAEVVVAINDQSSLFKATFTNDSNNLLLFPVDPAAETIQVVAKTAEDDALIYANSVLLFPTNEFSYIALYQNNTLLKEKVKAATLFSGVYSSWNITTSGNLVISVDGTPNQDYTFTTSDFDGAAFNTLTLANWVAVINQKFAGITATETASGRLQLVSNKEGSSSALAIIGGTYLDKIFGELPITAVGQNSDFQLNRQTGNLRILSKITAGDSITAGTADAKGSAISSTTTTGTYNLSVDTDGRSSVIVAIPDDATVTYRVSASPAISSTITVSDQGLNVMRLMSSGTSFAYAQPRDYVYITHRFGSATWLPLNNCGLFQIVAKGGHTSAGVDTYIEVKNLTITAGAYTVADNSDLQIFGCSAYPQIWKGIFTPTPAAASLQDIVTSFAKNLVNIDASIFQTSSLKLTSSTEAGGSIAIPVSVGRSENLYVSGGSAVDGNQSHIANVISEKSLAASFFKPTTPTDTNADGVTGKAVWLDRVTYGDITGALTESSAPGTIGVNPYGDILQSTGVLGSDVAYTDIYNGLEGNNSGHYRSVKAKLSGDRIGTQYELPSTVMNNLYGDKFNLLRPITISPEDSVVFIMDNDAVAKTIDIQLGRTGKVNTSFPATNLSFSADDVDNEPGITFSNLQTWGTSTNNTNFQDYSMWMSARNWYVTGGAGSGGSGIILRSIEKGKQGERLRFSIQYPSIANKTALYSYQNAADSSSFTYVFGSDINKNINITAGDTFTVSALGSDIYRYTFSAPATDLSSLLVGDVVSMLADSGVTTANRGQFKIQNISIPSKYFDVHNTNGAATGAGTAEVTTVTTIADVVGTQTVSVVSSVAPAVGLDGKWFKINDSAGLVAVWYNVGTPAPTPGSLGVNRVITVGPLVGSESATVVAALTAGTIGADQEFTASYLTTTVTITNRDNGSFPVAIDGTSATGFGFAGTLGSANNSLNGKYFTLYDVNGSVAFWFDTTGATQEPVNTADRAVRISTVAPGNSANTVAAATAMVVNAETTLNATSLTNVITVTDASIGARTSPSANTSGFTTAVLTPGVNGTFETILIPSSVYFFELLGTAVTDIVATINTSPLITAAELPGATTITKATKDEVYTPAGPTDYSASLAYGHDPDPITGLNTYVSFYDGINWIREFSNSSPNFILKTTMTLQGSAPLAYSMTSCPNPDATTGEYFELVPVTLNNIYHHFTQKALSQLPIVADVDVSQDIRNIQVKSKELGSAGAVEIVGGNGNNSIFVLQNDAQESVGGGAVYGELKIASNPVTIAEGDIVKINNTIPAKRKNSLRSASTLSVDALTGSQAQYLYNPATTNTNQFVSFAISDVSASYGRSSGVVWRYQHNDSGSVYQIQALLVGAPAVAPTDKIANGSVGAANLDEVIIAPGSASTKLTFQLGVYAVPTQADYFIFETASGVTFAVWFDVNNVGTAPTGASYLAATNKIEVNITSGMTPNQVMSALTAVLDVNATFLLHFDGSQGQGASFAACVEGDVLNVINSNWSAANNSFQSGAGKIGGFPIIGIGANYVDAVNPKGAAMSSTLIGTGSLNVCPSPVIQWKLAHYAKPSIAFISLAAPMGTATVTCNNEHRLKVGDAIQIQDNGLAQTTTVVSVPSQTTFTFTDTTGNPGPFIYEDGYVYTTGKTVTRYKISEIGVNKFFKLEWVSGESPRFIDCGMAIDDQIVIGGSTFKSANATTSRVIGVSNTYVIYENLGAVDEKDTYVPFNNLSETVVWTGAASFITGASGAFKNLTVGDWVKKADDDNTLLVQVTAFLNNVNVPTTAALAVKVSLGDTYKGTSGVALGTSLNETTGINTGVYLSDYSDISGVCFDSAQVGDTLFIDKFSDPDWFENVNAGTFTVNAIGTDSALRPYLQVINANAQDESGVIFGADTLGLFVKESADALFESYRIVHNTVVDAFNSERRQVYVSPSTALYKMSTDYGTQVIASSKMGYPTGIVTGIDGYTYYTGLLRTVQRIVDGYEPDPIAYPGRRAVGAAIETMPPLIKKISMSLEITTDEGVNLNEISSDISSAIIRYVNNLGVGADLVLSEVIVRVMGISGVAAVTFTSPAPSTERISASSEEKILVRPEDIFLS